MQIGGFYADVFRFGHGAGEVSLHLAQPLFAQKLQVSSGDEGTLAVHGVDKAGLLQLRVGPFGGDDADAQIVRQGADGGKGVALGQLSGHDGRLDLTHDLLVDGLAASV